jgi:hypothetical protein
VIAADSVTPMRVRRVAVEATPVDITLLPVERPELVSLSKEVNDILIFEYDHMYKYIHNSYN